jgi:hypothetical protein
VEFYFVASSVRKPVWTLVRQTAWAALQHVRVMEQPIKQRRDSGGVVEQPSTGRVDVKRMDARS